MKNYSKTAGALWAFHLPAAKLEFSLQDLMQ